jgi:hypothetical protein
VIQVRGLRCDDRRLHLVGGDSDLEVHVQRLEVLLAAADFAVVYEMLDGRLSYRARKCSAVTSRFLSTPSRMATLGTTMTNLENP